MENCETFRFKIPAWSLCYIINGDAIGLEKEEIEMINNFLKVNNVEIVSPVDDFEEYFSWHPEFGEPGEVVDCDVNCRI